MKLNKKANLVSLRRREGYSSGDIGAPGLLAVFYFFELSRGYTCSVCDHLMTIFMHFPAYVTLCLKNTVG